MSQSFKGEAWNAVWQGATLTEEQRQAVRDKARWEHITLSAALRWMYPDAWQEVLDLSEVCT